MKSVLCTILLFILFVSSTSAADTWKASQPAEMIYERNVIDPTCIYAAIHNFRLGKPTYLKNRCDEISSLQGNDVGGTVTQGVLTVSPRLGLGYDYDLGEGMGTHGHFYYKYLGATPEGLVILSSYSGGGTGQFSDLSIYRREGDTLGIVRNIAKGDRCSGGVKDAQVSGASLNYTQLASSNDLYKKYLPQGAIQSHRSPIDCSALISIQDGQPVQVELLDDFKLPDCAQTDDLKEMQAHKVLSDEDARIFAETIARTCAWIR